MFSRFSRRRIPLSRESRELGYVQYFSPPDPNMQNFYLRQQNEAMRKLNGQLTNYVFNNPNATPDMMQYQLNQQVLQHQQNVQPYVNAPAGRTPIGTRARQIAAERKKQAQQQQQNGGGEFPLQAAPHLQGLGPNPNAGGARPVVEVPQPPVVPLPEHDRPMSVGDVGSMLARALGQALFARRRTEEGTEQVRRTLPAPASADRDRKTSTAEAAKKKIAEERRKKGQQA